MNVLIVDTETTGLNPADAQVIEIGAILFSVAERSVLASVSFLIPCEANPAEGINGITATLTNIPQPWQTGMTLFAELVSAAEVMVAHNAEFDRKWFDGVRLPRIELPWVCTMNDVRWGRGVCHSLRELALLHRVPVWDVHRALSDCQLIASIFETRDDLLDLIQHAMRPRTTYRAVVSYDNRHLAKDAGFRWDSTRKIWTRNLLPEEIPTLPFAVTPLTHALVA